MCSSSTESCSTGSTETISSHRLMSANSEPFDPSRITVRDVADFREHLSRVRRQTARRLAGGFSVSSITIRPSLARPGFAIARCRNGRQPRTSPALPSAAPTAPSHPSSPLMIRRILVLDHGKDTAKGIVRQTGQGQEDSLQSTLFGRTVVISGGAPLRAVTTDCRFSTYAAALQLPKLDVGGSNPLARFNSPTHKHL